MLFNLLLKMNAAGYSIPSLSVLTLAYSTKTASPQPCHNIELSLFSRYACSLCNLSMNSHKAFPGPLTQFGQYALPPAVDLVGSVNEYASSSHSDWETKKLASPIPRPAKMSRFKLPQVEWVG